MRRANLIGVGDGNRRGEHAELVDKRQPGHLTTAVERVEGRKGMIVPDIPMARHNHRDASAGNTWCVVNQGGVANEHVRNVGYSVTRASGICADSDAQVAQSWPAHGILLMTHYNRFFPMSDISSTEGA